MRCRVLARQTSHPAGEGVSVIHPAPTARRINEDDETFYARVFAETIHKNPSMQGLAHVDTEVDQLPTRRFRNAWRVNGARHVEVDLPVARQIRMQEIRVERDAKLVASDGPLLRNQEQGKDVTALKAYRQTLREIPQTMDLMKATTPEELATLVPAWPVQP